MMNFTFNPVRHYGGDVLKLAQTFQMPSGTLLQGGVAMPLNDAKLGGSAIAFTAGGQRYAGNVVDGRMSGTRQDGKRRSATRTGSGRAS